MTSLPLLDFLVLCAIHGIDGTGFRLPLKTLQCNFFSSCLSRVPAFLIFCSIFPALYRPSWVIPSHLGVCLSCLHVTLFVVMLTLLFLSADLRDADLLGVLDLLGELALRVLSSTVLAGVADLCLFRPPPFLVHDLLKCPLDLHLLQ